MRTCVCRIRRTLYASTIEWTNVYTASPWYRRGTANDAIYKMPHTLWPLSRIRISSVGGGGDSSSYGPSYTRDMRWLLCIQFAFILHEPVTFHLFQMLSLCIRKEINSNETIRDLSWVRLCRSRWRCFRCVLVCVNLCVETTITLIITLVYFLHFFCSSQVVNYPFYDWYSSSKSTNIEPPTNNKIYIWGFECIFHPDFIELHALVTSK